MQTYYASGELQESYILSVAVCPNRRLGTAVAQLGNPLHVLAAMLPALLRLSIFVWH